MLPKNPLNEVNKNEGKSGLFGLKQKSVYRVQDDSAEKNFNTEIVKP